MFFLDVTLESKIAYEGKTTDSQVGSNAAAVLLLSVCERRPPGPLSISMAMWAV
jgi:hypothetical protein